MASSAQLRPAEQGRVELTCWAPDCAAPRAGRCGLCGPCERVYRAAFGLYHALCARELARLEQVAPGAAGIAERVLARRLSELEPERDLANAELMLRSGSGGRRGLLE